VSRVLFEARCRRRADARLYDLIAGLLVRLQSSAGAGIFKSGAHGNSQPDVDTWAVQHPGDGSRRAIQSVGLHLARMLVQLEQGLSGKAAYAAMVNFAARKAELPELPPRAAYSMTVADVVNAIESEDHISAIHRWAETTWRDWSDQHDFIRDWVRGVSSKG
jgi:hypothetical protein